MRSPTLQGVTPYPSPQVSGVAEMPLPSTPVADRRYALVENSKEYVGVSERLYYSA